MAPEMKKRIREALLQTIDAIAADGGTSDMAPDYIDIHGGDLEAAKAYWKTTEAIRCEIEEAIGIHIS